MQQFGKIRYHGSGGKLLLGKAVTAQKQIAKTDIYRRQHWNNFYDGFPYKVPNSVHLNTPEQTANRNKFKQAMIAWNGLTESEKAIWHEKAVGQSLLGHNLFVKYFYENN